MEIVSQNAKTTQALGEKIGLDVLTHHGQLGLRSHFGEGGDYDGRGQGSTAKILALYGELGSGKTTFVQGIAKALGLPDRLVSPTFIIVREYPLSAKNFHRFYHIDLYRLENLEVSETLGFSEIFADPKALVIIEWATKLGKKLPKKRMDIYFEILSENKRLISISESI